MTRAAIYARGSEERRGTPVTLPNLPEPGLVAGATTKPVGYLPRAAAPRPTPESGKVPRRDRRWLAEEEVERLIKAAGATGRHGHRDATLILVAYRHGLRVSEVADLRWSQILFDQAVLSVTRRKHGTPASHELSGRELRALRRLPRRGEWVFTSERGGPLSIRDVHHIVSRAGRVARFSMPIHPHMLRHAAGYYLANKGIDTRRIQGFLGHRNISNTVIYTELAPGRYRGLWKD